MLDRLGRLALPSERHAPVVLGLGAVRLDAQRLLIMLVRLGPLALPSERHAPIAVGLGVVRLDAQRLLIMLDRIGQLALFMQNIAEVVPSDESIGVNREGVGPQPLRVAPDLALVPGENS